jgi:hypothetical protein
LERFAYHWCSSVDFHPLPRLAPPQLNKLPSIERLTRAFLQSLKLLLLVSHALPIRQPTSHFLSALPFQPIPSAPSLVFQLPRGLSRLSARVTITFVSPPIFSSNEPLPRPFRAYLFQLSPSAVFR